MFPDNFEITSVPSKMFCSFISKSFSEKSYGGTTYTENLQIEWNNS